MSLSDSARFLAAFVRDPTRIGAIAPSSPALARAMVRGLDFADRRAVLEFGPGTGPFTLALREALPDPASYLGIERDTHFVELLRVRFPDMRFVCGSAEDAHAAHQEAGLGEVGAIISGLPFASLPPTVQDGIIDSIDRLARPGCEFRTFQYVHAYALPAAVRFRKKMRELFGPHRRSAPVLRNLPPSFVLSWRR
ncbi:MAG: ribosomal RNA adenine dimethylase domain-containing protein [Planctomycetota bacterium]|nr:ribosomal RNA adenine dimethylase domain-containing protein [Planctomycetota bacterium]